MDSIEARKIYGEKELLPYVVELLTRFKEDGYMDISRFMFVENELETAIYTVKFDDYHSRSFRLSKFASYEDDEWIPIEGNYESNQEVEYYRDKKGFLKYKNRNIESDIKISNFTIYALIKVLSDNNKEKLKQCQEKYEKMFRLLSEGEEKLEQCEKRASSPKRRFW